MYKYRAERTSALTRYRELFWRMVIQNGCWRLCVHKQICAIVIVYVLSTSTPSRYNGGKYQTFRVDSFINFPLTWNFSIPWQSTLRMIDFGSQPTGDSTSTTVSLIRWSVPENKEVENPASTERTCIWCHVSWSWKHNGLLVARLICISFYVTCLQLLPGLSMFLLQYIKLRLYTQDCVSGFPHVHPHPHLHLHRNQDLIRCLTDELLKFW